MPEPPRPPAMWDGAMLDAHEMYRAYNDLPEDVQERAVKVHFLCMDALEHQHATALRALWARYMLGVVTRELPYNPDSLYDVPPRKPVHEYLTLVRDEDEEPDPDAVMLAKAARQAEAHVRALLAERDRAALAEQAEDTEDASPEDIEDASPEDTEDADATTPEVTAATAVALPEPPATPGVGAWDAHASRASWRWPRCAQVYRYGITRSPRPRPG